MFEIKPYQSVFLAETLALFQLSVRQIASRDYSEEQINSWIDVNPEHWQSKMESNTLLAIYNKQVVGLIKCDQGYIDLLFVHPNFVRKGIAKMLYNEIEQDIRWKKIEKIEANVSLTAKPFFLKMGFELITQQKVIVRQTEFINFKMQKRL